MSDYDAIAAALNRQPQNPLLAYGQSGVDAARDWIARNTRQSDMDDPGTNLARAAIGTALGFPVSGAQHALNWMNATDQAFNGVDPRETLTPEDMLAPTGAGVMGAMASPRNAVGVFGGRLAKTADQEALAKAEQMATSGADRDAIWNETGWFKGPDDKWRFEIDDSGAKKSWRWPTGLMEKVVKHPELYDAYPAVGDIPVRRTHDMFTAGGYSPAADSPMGKIFDSPSIVYNRAAIKDLFDNPRDEMLSTLLHEAQHAVQKQEGFATGGSGFDPNYHRLAGEVESRNVQTRRHMTAEERQAKPPWKTQDVPDEQQVVRDWPYRQYRFPSWAHPIHLGLQGAQLTGQAYLFGLPPFNKSGSTQVPQEPPDAYLALARALDAQGSYPPGGF